MPANKSQPTDATETPVATGAAATLDDAVPGNDTDAVPVPVPGTDAVTDAVTGNDDVPGNDTGDGDVPMNRAERRAKAKSGSKPQVVSKIQPRNVNHGPSPRQWANRRSG